MKITRVETIWFEALPQAEWAKTNATARQALPNNLWVRIHTDTGLSGLGESYYLPRAVAAIIHDVFAPLLIGRDPRDIENHWSNLFALVNFCGAMGAEMRAISAIDVALWDLCRPDRRPADLHDARRAQPRSHRRSTIPASATGNIPISMPG